jgi:hypothetical protein
VNGKEFKSKSYVINVKDSPGANARGSLGQSPHQLMPSDPADTPAQSTSPDIDAAQIEGAKVDPDYFIQTVLSKKEAVVGEQLVLKVYLYTAWRAAPEVLREPGTEGFWVENLLPNRRQYEIEEVLVNGRKYDRVVLRKYALFPIKPETLTIAPTIVELETRRGGIFSRRKTVKRVAVPVQVEIKPPPQDAQPDDFVPANVGQYAFTASVDNQTVKTGEPITLKLSVRGKGNLRNLVLPELKEVTGFKVYAPESDVNVRAIGDSITGDRTSRILMIPKGPGQFTIPSISWTFYNPFTGKYVSPLSKPHKITVQKGDGFTDTGAVANPTKTETVGANARLNRRLRSILSRAELEVTGHGSTLKQSWFYGLVIFVTLLYLSLVIASQTRKKIAENRIKGRSKRAITVARRRLDQIEKEIGKMATEVFFAELQRCLITFLENRLETPVAGDTVVELRDRLQERGFGAEHADQVVTELETCEFARFARSAGKKEEKSEALNRLQALIKELAKINIAPLPKVRR